MKLVSVIITTHNGSHYINRAIESVLKQTYDNIEIIVVDDNGLNSKEQMETQQRINKYIKEEVIKYLPHEKNCNGAVARNTGAKAAQGYFLAFLDDDDMYLPERIRSSVKELDKMDESWALAYCSAILTYRNTNIIRKAKKEGNILFELLTHKSVIGTSSILIRKKAYENLKGFDESFKRHQDYEFTARVAYNYKIKAVPAPGFIYFRGSSRNKPKTNEKAIEYRKHYINKMMPIINSFSKRKKQIIICLNILEVTSMHLRRMDIFKFIKVFNSLISIWISKVNKIVYFEVLFMKINIVLKRNWKLTFSMLKTKLK